MHGTIQIHNQIRLVRIMHIFIHISILFHILDKENSCKIGRGNEKVTSIMREREREELLHGCLNSYKNIGSLYKLQQSIKLLTYLFHLSICLIRLRHSSSSNEGIHVFSLRIISHTHDFFFSCSLIFQQIFHFFDLFDL